jgi:hypothetical protein
MSTTNFEQLEGLTYGVIERDLSQDRPTETDYELIRFPQARFLTAISVPTECYLHFGAKQAPALDLRNFIGQPFQAAPGETVGAVYLENPTNVTGTLQLFHGANFLARGNQEIGDVSNIEAIGGQSQSGVDIASKIDDLEDALASIGDDQLRVELVTDSLGSNLDIDLAAQSLDKLTANPTERTPSTATDSGTGSANAAELDLGADGGRTPVDVFADTSGDATLTVEVSKDGAIWRTYNTYDRTGATARVDPIDTAYRHIRAYLNQNRNQVEISAKGV